jgi:hypothetical protein
LLKKTQNLAISEVNLGGWRVSHKQRIVCQILRLAALKKNVLEKVVSELEATGGLPLACYQHKSTKVAR